MLKLPVVTLLKICTQTNQYIYKRLVMGLKLIRLKSNYYTARCFGDTVIYGLGVIL